MEQLNFTYKESVITDVKGNVIKTVKTRYLNGRQWSDADVWYYNQMNALLEKEALSSAIEKMTEATTPRRRKAVAV